MIWLLALQLSLLPQQQHYDNAKDALAKMEFSRADEEVDLALKADPKGFTCENKLNRDRGGADGRKACGRRTCCGSRGTVQI